MARTIFWSWQSDEPQRETRHIMREALAEAIAQLGAELEEAERPELDHDTKGAGGSPEIVRTILRKVEAASVFVADVTPVAATAAGKQVPNPNVMLELGYARSVLGLDRIILVWNMAIFESRYADLPFDLQGLGKSCGFKLPPGASKGDYRTARTGLIKHLKARLEETLPAPPQSLPVPESEWHGSLASDPSIWEEAYNPLAVNFPRQGRIDVIVAPGPRIYARLLPATQGAAPAVEDGLFPSWEHHLRPIGDRELGGLSGGRTANGHVLSAPIGEDRTTKTIVRWYKDNGEIWAVSAWGFYKHGDHSHVAYDEVIRDLVRWLEKAVQSSRAAGGTGPFKIRLGAGGLHGVHWQQGRPSPGSNLFFALRHGVESEATLADESADAILAAVTAFMAELAESFGVAPLSPQSVATLAEKT